ncbi:TPR-like protein [Pyrenochaeta sp. DS3sAY3a]|nr:TPR-like protein [Pyrenochaeta sp. DS3sAY3a]
MASIAIRNDNSGFQGRDIYGAVNATFNLPPKRQDTPPYPCAYIPFSRDSDFVERGTILNQLTEKCAVGGSRTALVGLGGVGKSQLAIEHCYRTAEQSPETWVFWVHASNAARIEQGYRDIADLVRLEGRDDRQTDIFMLVHNWLRNEKHGRWLLVLDNADDAEALTLPAATAAATQAGSRDDIHPRSILSHLPWSKNGSVLVTSRTKSVARQLVEEDDILAVQPMEMATGTELLHKKLGAEVDKSGVADLAAALDFMPLALVQAAAYIRQRAPRCSVQRYLEEFRKSDRKRTGLLDYDGGHLRRDREANNSILLTWQISFDYILQARPSAADLLSLMSFFDRQGIPEVLLRRGSRNVANVNSVSDSEASIDDRIEEDTGFEEDILMLRNYSFIKTTAETTTFEMHRLVQLATRKWLEEHGQLETWKQQSISSLCSVFPTGEHENWTECQALFPHAKSALSQPPQSQESRQQWAFLLYNAAWYAWQKGNISDADQFSLKSREARRKILGPEHVDTLSSIAMSGIAASLAGRWKEAEELEVQVMETSVRVLGEEHPSTLMSIGNLASTYRNQGRWKEAEELEVQVMETRKRVVGEEHPDTLTSIGNLASTVLGEEHPDTLTSIANLASTYWNQGRWKEAEELFVQVMETRMRVLGEEHPDTLTSIANLASTYMTQGRWKEAEAMTRKTLAQREKVLGPQHPDTLMSVYSLAYLLAKQRFYIESSTLYERACAGYDTKLGEDHPTTRACRQHYVEAIAQRNEEQRVDATTPATPDGSIRIHTKKVSKLTRGLAKLGIKSLRDKNL